MYCPGAAVLCSICSSDAMQPACCAWAVLGLVQPGIPLRLWQRALAARMQGAMLSCADRGARCR